MNDIIQEYIAFTSKKAYRQVSRSNLITPFFKGEFNISGAHSYLIPAIRSDEKVSIDAISVVDLCVRKIDSGIIGFSTNHLLLFEMGVFGQFGYIKDIRRTEEEQIRYLIELLENFMIPKEKLVFTICKGGNYINKEIPFDSQTYEILKNCGITDFQIIPTMGRRNFMLSRGIDRLAGYNVEVFVIKNNSYLEVASMNIYRYINKITCLKETINTGIGCGVGFDRIKFYNSNKTSIYQLDPFATIFEKTKDMYGETNILLIEDKIVRLVELIKAVVFIISDGQTFDKTPQAKTLTTYISKIASELFYLEIDFIWFYDLTITNLRKHYFRYRIKDESITILLEMISDRINRLKENKNN